MLQKISCCCSTRHNLYSVYSKMWSNELGRLPVKMPSLLKPGQPNKHSMGISSVFFFFIPRASWWTSQNFSGSFFASGLSVPTLFPSSGSHLSLTSTLILCSAIDSPEAITQSACDSASFLDLSSFSWYFRSSRQDLFLSALYTAAHTFYKCMINFFILSLN